MSPTTDIIKIMAKMKKENEQARLDEYEEVKN